MTLLLELESRFLSIWGQILPDLGSRDGELVPNSVKTSIIAHAGKVKVVKSVSDRLRQPVASCHAMTSACTACSGSEADTPKIQEKGCHPCADCSKSSPTCFSRHSLLWHGFTRRVIGAVAVHASLRRCTTEWCRLCDRYHVT